MSSEISKGLKEAYKSIYLQKNIDVVDEHNIEEGIAKDIVKGVLKYGSEAITKSAQKYGPKVVKAGKGAIKDVAKIPLKGAETAFKAVVKPLQTPLGSLAATAAGAEALLAGEKSKVRQGASWVSQQAQKGIQTAYGDNSSQQKPATARQPSRPKPEKPKPQTISKLYEKAQPALTLSAGRTGTGVGKGFKSRPWTKAEAQRYKTARGADQIRTDAQLTRDVAAMNKQIAATPKGKDPEFYRPPTPTQRPPAPRPLSSGAGKSGPAASAPRPAAAKPAPTPQPKIEKSPAGYAVGTAPGGVKFERRAATRAELDAAQAARKAAQEVGKSKPEQELSAVKAGVSASKKPVKEETMKYDAYDLVLEYLFSQGHVDTLEEALYVMMEMDGEVIRDIVSESGYFPTPESQRADEAKYRKMRNAAPPSAKTKERFIPGDDRMPGQPARPTTIPGK
jgi:hypothetical protein